MFTNLANCTLESKTEDFSRRNAKLTGDEVAQTENAVYPICPSGEDVIRFLFSIFFLFDQKS